MRLLLLLLLISCKGREAKIASPADEELVTHTETTTTQVDQIANYRTQVECDSISYAAVLNPSAQTLEIKKNKKIFKIPVTLLSEEVMDEEVVAGFELNCSCLDKGIALQFDFDLRFYSYKKYTHHLLFERDSLFVSQFFGSYSNRQEETLLGYEFLKPEPYSYDVINNLEDKSSVLIHFQNFQDEDYQQNIDTYYKTIKQLFDTKQVEFLKLKASILALEMALNYVDIQNALVEYNNIAYYLENSEAYEASIFLLEKIIKEAPNRTVAYLNLADAYWGSGQLQKAKEAYTMYMNQMKEQSKVDKVPARAYSRI